MSVVPPTAPAPAPPGVRQHVDHGKSRLPSLTGMRWLAALLIFCLHIQSESNFFLPDSTTQDVLGNVLAAGRSGVSFFYILSGFVLAWSARPTDTKAAFWRRRFSKIYPNHLAGLLLALVFWTWVGRNFSSEALLYNLTLTQSWPAHGNSVWYAFNGPSWSLSCEALFYLCFPFLYAVLRRASAWLWWSLAALSAAFVMAAPAIAKPVSVRTGWSEHYLTYHLPPVRMVEFLLGICIALLVRHGRWRGPGMTVSGLVIVAGMAFAATFSEKWGLARDGACTVVGYSLLLCAAARADIRGTRSLWRSRRMVWLGEVSFAFYLVHETAIYTLRHLFPDEAAHLPWYQGAGLVLAAFTMAFAVAALMFEYIEKPMMQRLTAPLAPRG